MKKLLKKSFQIKSYIILTIIISIFGFTISPILSLELTQSVNQSHFNTDSNQNNTVTYTLEVKNTNSCTQAVDVMLAFDKSGSMDDENTSPPQPLTDAKQAAYNFLDKLEKHKDQVGLVSFSNKAKRDSPLTSDATAVKQLIKKIKADKFTNLADAVSKSIDELLSVRHNKNAKSVIILFSDGQANRPQNSSYAIKEAIEKTQKAKDLGIEVITVGLGQKNLDKDTLQKMASQNKFFWAPDTTKMHEIYENIAKSFSGTVPEVVVWDDVSDLNQIANFVSASDNGIPLQNKIKWELGDIQCGETKTLQYSYKFHNSIPETHTRTNTFFSTNQSSSEILKSNPITIKTIGPWLTISKINNLSTNNSQSIDKKENFGVRNGDTIKYEIKLKNTNEGKATNISMSDILPQYLFYIDSNIPNLKIDNNTLNWTVEQLNPQEEKTYLIKAKLFLPELFTNDTITNKVIAINDNQEISAENKINIIYDNNNNFQKEQNDNNEIPIDQTLINSNIQQIDNNLANQDQVEIKFDKSHISSNCINEKIYIKNAQIISKNPIVLAEYSIDGGNNWYPISSHFNKNEINLNFETKKLPDKLYGIQIRVQSISGQIFHSNIIKFLQNCSSNQAILANYYQNGSTKGILNNNNDLLFNSDLPLHIYAETLGAVKDLEVVIQSSQNNQSKEKINKKDTQTTISLNYNYNTQIWSAHIPASAIKQKENNVWLQIPSQKHNKDNNNQLLSDKYIIKKQIASIINPFFDENMNIMEITDKTTDQDNFQYEVYNFTHYTWQKFNYSETINQNKQTTNKNKKFNLFPGKYFIKVTYPDSRIFYTEKFEIQKPSIIKVNTQDFDSSNLFSIFDPFIRQLEIESSLNKNYSKDLNTKNTKFDKNNLYIETFDKYIAPNTEKLYLFYWNRWDPHFDERFQFLPQIENNINKTNNTKFLVFTDPNNIQELERIVKINKSKINYIEIKNPKFLSKEVKYNPLLITYKPKLKEINYKF